MQLLTDVGFVVVVLTAGLAVAQVYIALFGKEDRR
jgi:hypothetical protein